MPESKKKQRPSLNSLRHVLREIMLPRWKLLATGLFLILLSRFAGLALPYSTKYLIDDVIGGEGQLGPILWIVGVAVLVQAGSSFLLTRLLSVEAQHLIAQMRIQIQRHVLRLPVSSFDNSKSGELVSRIMNDVEGVRNLVGTGLVQMIGGTLTAGVALTLVVEISATMTVLAIIPLALFGLASMKAFKTLRPTFRKRRRIQAEVIGRLTESLGGIRVIKGFNAEASEDKVFESGILELFRNIRTTMTTSAAITSLATLLMGIASLVIMGYGGHLVMQEELTLGEFVSFSLFLGFLITPIVQMANIGTQITDAFAGLDRMAELIGQPIEDDDERRTVDLQSLKGHVIFEDVRFAYEGGENVLEDISFDVPPGTLVALVGSSGSGKSTIAGLAASFMTPTSGRVRIDGHDAATLRLSSYRRHLGLVLQDGFLFDGSIRDNLLFANQDASEEQLQDAVRRAHVHEFVDRFENGLETIIGERGVKLSGGQKQRVEIARALLADPRILILDEATSNLDTESESFIQNSLESLMSGRTTLVIAHRLTTIRKADVILVVEQGRIVERGNHETLIEAKGRYHDLYTYQARI
ncbi:MAG: ABC-type multidrug transport system fused ATPase/permease subunit [Planctomycetota bacterium]|jgi:ABC-type multidrug transport system fused ATPase/permease subunit